MLARHVGRQCRRSMSARVSRSLPSSAAQLQFKPVPIVEVSWSSVNDRDEMATLRLMQSACERALAGKITCASCGRSCKDQAVKVGDKYFHVDCFVCKGLLLDGRFQQHHVRHVYITFLIRYTIWECLVCYPDCSYLSTPPHFVICRRPRTLIFTYSCVCCH